MLIHQREALWPVLVSNDTDSHTVLSIELSDLHHQQADQRVEQHGQDGNRKQRAAISQLIAHLAVIDQLYVAPVHLDTTRNQRGFESGFAGSETIRLIE